MSDTPKTDAACFAVVSNDPQSVVVWADFARQLERENAALRDDRNELRTALFAQQKHEDEAERKWAQESASLKIRGGMLERDNAALRKLLREAITSLARHRAALGKEAQP